MKLSTYHHLTPGESQELSDQLDQLLANYQIAEQNAQKIYWNSSLKPYLTFHHRVGQLYESNRTISNAVADTILKLGYTPTSNGAAQLAKANILAVEQVHTFDDAAKLIIQNSQELLQSVKIVFEKAAEFQEQNTMALMNQLAQQLVMNIHFFLNMRSAMMN